MRVLFFISNLILFLCSCSDDNAPGGNSNGGAVTGIVITTTVATSVTNNSAISGGNITADGGSQIINRGLCWSTNPNPTIANSHTTDSNGIGVYSSNIINLNSGTLYYLRAYATNSTTTTYGNQITFTTLSASSGGCAGGPSTVADIDGNVYNVVTIGNQCWMKENLKTTRYRNGTAIQSGLSDAQWVATTSGAYAIYDNLTINDSIYGKLYNWYAVADTNGLCPIGWHIPTTVEWTTLENYLGGPSLAGGNMIGNVGATNSSGFTGLLGGQRDWMTGWFGSLSDNGYWWAAPPNAYVRVLIWNSTQLAGTNEVKQTGCSVRCVRD